MNLEPDFDKLESSDLDDETFTNIYANLIQSSVAGALANVVGALRIEAQIPSQSGETLTAQLNLENVWRACKDQPGKRLAFIEPQITTMRDSTKLTSLSSQDVENNLIPLIRRTEEVDQMEEKIGQKLVRESLGADLSMVYGINSRAAVGYLSPEGRSSVPLDDSDLREKAVQNLKDLLGGEISLKGGPTLWVLASGRDFESGLLLNRKFMRNMTDMVKGSPIVAVPARDILVICGEDSQEDLVKMRTFVQEMFESSPHPISPKQYFYSETELIEIG
ncbi:DUF1444 family protein [Candidatus Obscuribacterales bacterium]|nr:DUF1444 family protein [Candidatus Obscuribacterales bacterium]